MHVAKNIENDQAKLRALQQNTQSILLPNIGHDINRLEGTLQQLSKVIAFFLVLRLAIRCALLGASLTRAACD